MSDSRRIKLTDDDIVVEQANDPMPKEEKYEDIEIWSFTSLHGLGFDHVIRVDQGDKAVIMTNAIDKTPVEIVLTFHGGEKNEAIGGVRYQVHNLLRYGMEKSRQRVYERGESPVELELKRRADVQQRRAAAFEKRQAEMEREFDEEMRKAEQG